MIALMAATDWEGLHVLERWQHWGEWRHMSRDLIIQLDSFCYQNQLRPLITSGTQGQHSPNSWHYKGRAVDVMFPGVALWELPKKVFKVALHYDGFTGLGIYNEWRLMVGAKPIGGMHFERESDELLPLKKKVWLRTSEGDLAPTAENLARYFPAPKGVAT